MVKRELRRQHVPAIETSNLSLLEAGWVFQGSLYELLKVSSDVMRSSISQECTAARILRNLRNPRTFALRKSEMMIGTEMLGPPVGPYASMCRSFTLVSVYAKMAVIVSSKAAGADATVL